MSNPTIVLAIALAGAILGVTPALAQQKPTAANVPTTPSEPSESSLTVGALQLGSDASLVVAGFDIHVESNSVVYSYYLKNAGSTELGVTATIPLPTLEASVDRSETWVLASHDPENPVGLTVTAAGTPVSTKAEIHAYALGIDRLAEIKAEHLPLIPFGADVDKALAALSPEAADRLAAAGIISPRNPAEPRTPLTPDWSLEVVRSWHQMLPPGKTTPVVIKFTPVKAQYRLVKGDQSDLDEIKDDVCLKPPVLGVLQSRLRGNGAWKVTEILLADDAPAHWVDSPRPTLSVQKPVPEAIVAFCGMDEKTASRPTVLGAAPDDSEGIRIVIFEPATN